jgi:D-glycero-alpha-D-manno-heptose 1-phosphate guanylyltransferase
MKAIVLCGGMGTRLGALTRDMPKPILQVADRPFLAYILDQLSIPEIDEIILSVGFEWKKIRALIGDDWRGHRVSYSIEHYPLGTGGAIKKAMHSFNCIDALVVNGDSFINIHPVELINFSLICNAEAAIVLKKMDDISRFGTVRIDQALRVTAFHEKARRASGLINAGFYYLKNSIFSLEKKEQFSFERDLLMQHSSTISLYGFETNAYFIDMGIPVDFDRAQVELKSHISLTR